LFDFALAINQTGIMVIVMNLKNIALAASELGISEKQISGFQTHFGKFASFTANGRDYDASLTAAGKIKKGTVRVSSI